MKDPAIVARRAGTSPARRSTQLLVTARCVDDGVHCGRTASKTKNFESLGQPALTFATREALSFTSVRIADAWRTGARADREWMVDIMVRSICVWPSLPQLPLSQSTISMGSTSLKPFRETADVSQTFCGLESTAKPAAPGPNADLSIEHNARFATSFCESQMRSSFTMSSSSSSHLSRRICSDQRSEERLNELTLRRLLTRIETEQHQTDETEGSRP